MKLPDQIKPERSLEIMSLLKGKLSKERRNKLIEELVSGHLKLAYSLAHKKEIDLDIAFELVFLCALKVKGSLNINSEPIKFDLIVYRTIRSWAHHHRAKSKTIYVPSSTYYKAKKKGVDIRVKIKQLNNSLFINPKQDDFEIRDQVDCIPLTEQEKKVLQLRLQNYNGPEIAKELGICKTSVQNIMNRIRVKYYETYPNNSRK